MGHGGQSAINGDMYPMIIFGGKVQSGKFTVFEFFGGIDISTQQF